MLNALENLENDQCNFFEQKIWKLSLKDMNSWTSKVLVLQFVHKNVFPTDLFNLILISKYL